jgi:hypothetical protein
MTKDTSARSPSKNVRGKKTRSPSYKPGDHWVQCDRCASIIRSSDAMQTWDGLIVCPDDWEIRHPQDFVRGRSEDIAATDPHDSNTYIGLRNGYKRKHRLYCY